MAVDKATRSNLELFMDALKTHGLATIIVLGLLVWCYREGGPVLLDNFKGQTKIMQQQAETLDKLVATQQRQEQTHQAQLKILEDVKAYTKPRNAELDKR